MIIKAPPPNFAEILQRFPNAQHPQTVFAYAPNIYTRGKDVPPEILAHETVHLHRQKDRGVEEWWALYLKDAQFRYNEELLAHRAEYRYMIHVNRNRQSRRGALKLVAKKLVAPLYAYEGIITMEKAIKDLENG